MWLCWRIGVKTIEMLPQMTHLQRPDSVRPILVTLIYLHPVLPPYTKAFQISVCLVCCKAAEREILIRMLLPYRAQNSAIQILLLTEDITK